MQLPAQVSDWRNWSVLSKRGANKLERSVYRRSEARDRRGASGGGRKGREDEIF